MSYVSSEIQTIQYYCIVSITSVVTVTFPVEILKNWNENWKTSINRNVTETWMYTNNRTETDILQSRATTFALRPPRICWLWCMVLCCVWLTDWLTGWLTPGPERPVSYRQTGADDASASQLLQESFTVSWAPPVRPSVGSNRRQRSHDAWRRTPTERALPRLNTRS